MPGIERLHRIRTGETIRTIAQLYGITPLSLMDLNAYLDPTALVEGQQIRLPKTVRADLWPFTARIAYSGLNATGPPGEPPENPP